MNSCNDGEHSHALGVCPVLWVPGDPKAPTSGMGAQAKPPPTGVKSEVSWRTGRGRWGDAKLASQWCGGRQATGLACQAISSMAATVDDIEGRNWHDLKGAPCGASLVEKS